MYVVCSIKKFLIPKTLSQFLLWLLFQQFLSAIPPFFIKKYIHNNIKIVALWLCFLFSHTYFFLFLFLYSTKYKPEEKHSQNLRKAGVIILIVTAVRSRHSVILLTPKILQTSSTDNNNFYFFAFFKRETKNNIKNKLN